MVTLTPALSPQGRGGGMNHRWTQEKSQIIGFRVRRSEGGDFGPGPWLLSYERDGVGAQLGFRPAVQHRTRLQGSPEFGKCPDFKAYACRRVGQSDMRLIQPDAIFPESRQGLNPVLLGTDCMDNQPDFLDSPV